LRAPPTPCSSRQANGENWEGGSRFAEDFEDAKVIGSGSFAVVYRARNRIDKQEYAIKKTKKTLGRSARRQEMLQEALALASVAIDSMCPYIVRYFASWVEDERLFIQTELCDGSLKDCMLELRQTRPHDPRFDQGELSVVIRDVCTGLAVLHGKNLVHLDVKPENVLVKNLLPTPCRERSVASKIHKIADLGLATAAMDAGCDEINEGDSRYLAREVLQGNFSDLTKADVFSLGLTCYELATNPKELPCNGEEWHRLRDGCIEDCFASQLPSPMLALIRCMVHPIAAERPPCVEVLAHEAISQLRPKELPVDMVQELQSQLRRQTEAAEREQRRRASAEEKADRYWSELLHMKRQALIASTEQGQAVPEVKVLASPKPPRGYKRSLTT
jgi:serine/threonine protein kinase